MFPRVTNHYSADRSVKKYKTKDLLKILLFCAFARCSSKQEVSGSMPGLSGMTEHSQPEHRSGQIILSDVNQLP
ncbi:MAG TPA: hypothetical protein DF409_14895 [Bacteroidales bacterium]|nr:hypothetical protein [Bacteroidales bacterium]